MRDENVRDENGIEVLGRNYIIPCPGTLPALVFTEKGVSIVAVEETRPFRYCRRNVESAVEGPDGRTVIQEGFPGFVTRIDCNEEMAPNLLLYEA